MKLFVSLLKDESGATAIEYSLIAALISLAFIIALRMVGLKIAAIFNQVADALDSVNSF